ncbi:BgTH12-07967 [Blumeria graminis f. sp. triticale]|uniref:RNA helicase n=3 Tax=Blumeria graminis TaxID=34373 RepID=A0A381LA83_BLUGR|nr:ATP-dependent RNA helicase of the DEAD-box protein family [Blumeria graminis f. sp. tritici 96224]CAD6504703.1 BgTH12-07967 [Blumeria graminis f. sp. triticale]VDB92746.1 Bgt-163 [Blumeria graminis f. sp. tritici]
MFIRGSSPAISENEYDITEALAISGADLGDAESAVKNIGTLDASHIFDLGIDSDGEGDGMFIAAKQAASNRKISLAKSKSSKKSGGFQSMGLSLHLLKAISRKGFSVPTPIQRKSIPLILENQDVVGMARTGSGKTAAFVIPMIHKLKAHSTRVGARALILSPSRELALQTLKVVKELGKGTDLKCVLLVGGDSLEEQFASMATNPDIIIATPGRFLHLKVEMSLDLSSVKYVVFDEADRLFEMGFSTQLTEILYALPSSRQTLLFSATLPKSLVEFARAGLQEPSLVRLDAESKVSPDLENAFFFVKSAEKEGALLYILSSLIKMPTGQPKVHVNTEGENKKRKRSDESGSRRKPTEHSTIIFAATKHHVDYLASLLRLAGYAVSHAYGALDQVARNTQVEDFRTGVTNILVVTDVAARGIDIPILANVVNYDFPSQPKIFVHRVGRTARAGQRGWSFSLVRDTDVPYLLDLQLFLGRRLLVGECSDSSPKYNEDVVVGALPREGLEGDTEWVTKITRESDDLAALKSVAVKGEKLYIKTRNSASSESVKRAKEIIDSPGWSQQNILTLNEKSSLEQARSDMLARISGFRPQETIFEVGPKGKAGNCEFSDMMKCRRKKIIPRRHKEEDKKLAATDHIATFSDDDNPQRTKVNGDEDLELDDASEDEIEITFSKVRQKGKGRSLLWKDTENFMSYTPKTVNVAEERGYGVHSGQDNNFMEAARNVVMDLNNDDGGKSFAEPSRTKGMRWDKKNSKYVMRANDEDGSKGAKMVRGESGQKIAASFQSGRFDRWRKANRLDRPSRTGEAEKPSTLNTGRGHGTGARYRHRQEKAPKEADRYRDDYHVRKKRVAEAQEKRVGKWKDGAGKGETRTPDQIHRERKLAERKKAKNARPSRKGRS